MDEALHAAEQLADGLLHTLRLARALAGARRDVMLAGLADQVGFVCAKAVDLPPEAGRQLRPRLIALLAEVDAVSLALRNAPSPRPWEPARAGAFPSGRAGGRTP